MTFVVVLSTGRCGTQFLQKWFEYLNEEHIIATHEPLQFEYRPRSVLNGEKYYDLLAEHENIREHFNKINNYLSDGKTYIETGWPVFAWAPYIKDRFGNDVKFIHVTRHPIRFALSLKSIGFFQEQIRNDGWIKHCQIDPFLRDIKHSRYQTSWNRMSVLERCLYHWLEINEFIWDFCDVCDANHIFRVKSEQMFAKPGSRAELLQFCGIEVKHRINNPGFMDSHQKDMALDIDIHQIHKSEPLLNMSRKLLYDFLDIDYRKIEKRFSVGMVIYRKWQARIKRKIRKLLL